MLFPETERVIYAKNPLVEVLCQFRFHPILRIDSQEPVDYQDAIRDEYPVVREKLAASAQFPPEFLQQLPEQVKGSLGSRSYEFATEDDLWVVTLNKEFLAFTCNEYIRWEDFQDHLGKPYNAFIEIYKPSPFLRIGLRYKNVIKRSKLGLENVAWSELLEPHIAAELSDGRVSRSVQETAHNIVIDLHEENLRARLQHGFVSDETDKETCYLIDSDFFTEQRVEAENGIAILALSNRNNRNLFRWCITDRLHDAMGPKSI